MSKYRLKNPIGVEAITFDELVEFGKASGAPLHDGMPWSFNYKGIPITHENNDCYLIPSPEGSMRFERGDMLILDEVGNLYPMKMEVFLETHEKIE